MSREKTDQVFEPEHCNTELIEPVGLVISRTNLIIRGDSVLVRRGHVSRLGL